jgi:hypothetical protein
MRPRPYIQYSPSLFEGRKGGGGEGFLAKGQTTGKIEGLLKLSKTCPVITHIAFFELRKMDVQT